MAVGRKSPYMGHKVKMECTRGDLDKVDICLEVTYTKDMPLRFKNVFHIFQICVNKNSQFWPSVYDDPLCLITTAIASTGLDGWGR